MLNRKLNIWLLRHFLNSHCIPSIIINNTVRSFQRSVMNTRTLFPLLFTVASFSASAGNWAVKNGWCQTMTEDGQAPEMVKKAVHSIAERDVSVLQAFGVRMEFTRGDMLKVCPKFVTSLAGFSPKNRHPPLIKIPSCRLPGRHTPGNMTRKQQKPLILALTK